MPAGCPAGTHIRVSGERREFHVRADPLNSGCRRSRPPPRRIKSRRNRSVAERPAARRRASSASLLLPPGASWQVMTTRFMRANRCGSKRLDRSARPRDRGPRGSGDPKVPCKMSRQPSGRQRVSLGGWIDVGRAQIGRPHGDNKHKGLGQVRRPPRDVSRKPLWRGGKRERLK